MLVALKGLHTVVDPEVYIRWKAYLRYSSESSALDPFGLDPITWLAQQVLTCGAGVRFSTSVFALLYMVSGPIDVVGLRA